MNKLCSKIRQFKDSLVSKISKGAKKISNAIIKIARDKAYQILFVIFLFMIGFSLLIKYSFSTTEHVRTILGTSFQLIAGAVLIIEQVIDDSKLKKYREQFLKSYESRKKNYWLFTCYLIFILLFVVLYSITQTDNSAFEIAYISLFYAGLSIVPYVYGMKAVVRLSSKLLNIHSKNGDANEKGHQEKSVIWSNVIFFVLFSGLSLLCLFCILNITNTIIKGIILIFVAFAIFPVALLSFIFLFTVLIFFLFGTVREKYKLYWWLFVGLIWGSGGIMLLINLYPS